MPSSYTPVATKHASITIPSDGDAHAATTYAPGYQQCADRTEHLYTREIPSLLTQLCVANHSEMTLASAYSGIFFRASVANGIVFVTGTTRVDRSSDAGQTWSTSASGLTAPVNYYGVVYGAGVYVTAGTNAAQAIILSSADGSAWTERSNSIDGGLRGVVFAASLFVAVGDSGNIRTSSNGTAWTKRTPGSSFTGSFYDVASNGLIFVAVGGSGEIQTSPDGITWTKRTQAGGYAGDFLAVTYASGLFLAAGTSGEIQTSPDGITWTKRTQADSFSSTFIGAAYSAAFFLVGAGGVIQSSADGVSWKTISGAHFTSALYGIAASSRHVFMSGYSGSSGVIRRSMALV